MKKKIGVVFGGKSGEHKVSVITTLSVLKEINYERFDVLPIYVDVTGKWITSNVLIHEKPTKDWTFETLKTYLTIEEPNLFALRKEVDIFFPLIHGPNGEDGTLQGLFEMLDAPYVGSGVLGSSVGMDKIMMKKIFDASGIPQCRYLAYTKSDILRDTMTICEEIEDKLKYPCFIKPANAGSSLGITKAKNREELIEGLDFAFQFDTKVLIEETFVGRELEIGILGNEDILTSAVGEVQTTNDFYDYEAKYQNQAVTSIQIPAQVPAHVAERMSNIAKQVCRELNCFGLSRVDFFWNEQTNELVVNEINTIPGFTPYSMYPLLFGEVGMGYADLIARLLTLAEEKYQQKETMHVQHQHM